MRASYIMLILMCVPACLTDDSLDCLSNPLYTGDILCWDCDAASMDECNNSGRWQKCSGDTAQCSLLVTYEDGSISHIRRKCSTVDICDDFLKAMKFTCDDESTYNGKCVYCGNSPTGGAIKTLAACEENGGWGEWSLWSPCDVSCGSGHIQKERHCNNPAPTGDGSCDGKLDEIESQSKYCGCCPVDGTWGQWGVWGGCTATVGTCGRGTRSATRQCLNQACGGAHCDADGSSSTWIQNCDAGCCAVNCDCSMDDWSEWSSCGSSCGQSQQLRTRQCQQAECGGTPCDESAEMDTKGCNSGPCPPVSPPQFNGDLACMQCGIASSYEECIETGVLKPCVTDGVNGVCVSHQFFDPTGELLVYMRSCVTELFCLDFIERNAVCQNSVDGSRRCTDCYDFRAGGQCVITDGTWNEWGQWGPCSVSCGDGHKTRTRTCNEPECLGKPCGADDSSSSEHMACNTGCCPIDSYWEEWSEWSTCDPYTNNCGRGTQTRSRNCVQPICGGLDCDANESEGTESRECDGPCCSVNCDCSGSQWNPWSVCDVTCGSSTRVRTRQCAQPVCGGSDCAPSDEFGTKPCDAGECPPVDPPQVFNGTMSCLVCGLARTFEECVESGEIRECILPDGSNGACASHEFTEADGTPLLYMRVCVQASACLDWSAKNSVCQEAPNGLRRCTTCYDFREGGQCVTVNGSWTEWSPWGECESVLDCGQGKQYRTRECIEPDCGGLGCGHDGSSDKEERPCDDGCCPVNGEYGPWSDWTQCTVTCGHGTRSRTRQCNSPPPNECGEMCADGIVATDQQSCYRGNCEDTTSPCATTETLACFTCQAIGSMDCLQDPVGKLEKCNNPDDICFYHTENSTVGFQFSERGCMTRSSCENSRIAENSGEVCAEGWNCWYCGFQEPEQVQGTTYCCNEQPYLTTWNSWSSCTTLRGNCGLGFKSRERQCVTESCLDETCQGTECLLQKCNQQCQDG